MAQKCGPKNPFVLGAVVAVLGVAVGASSVVTSMLAYSLGSDSNAVVNTVNPRDEVVRPSTRNEFQDEYRDTEAVIRLQERRNERLREQTQQEVLHGAAPVDEEEEAAVYDARAYFRAYKACSAAGYTRSRLAACMEGVMNFGEYTR